jgi:PmbA protein
MNAPPQASAPSSIDGEAAACLHDTLRYAKAAGADAADALIVNAASLSLSVRLGAVEEAERSEAGDLGLRVFVGQRMAVVSTTDRRPETLRALAERAVAMARAVPDDPFCGIADPDALCQSWPALDLCDAREPSSEDLLARAHACEAAAQSVPGVSNSDGASGYWSRTHVTLAASNGFMGGYAVTRHAVSASVLAGSGTAMERDYAQHAATHATDLEAPEVIGRRAGERATARLHPRKVKSQAVPVIFDPRLSGGLIGCLLSAISGASVARGTSFLKDKMGQQILAAGLCVTEDPHLRRGLRSKPFDAEGLGNRRRALVEDGILNGWLLDLRSARQLGLPSTGHASRGAGGPPSPSPTNVWLEPGTLAPDALMADIKQGLYVTSMMGQGVNGITGDYSRGASGFWIEDGCIAYPVSEITVAGNLKSMFMNMIPANDLRLRYGIDAPTMRIDGMTVAGA